MHGLTDDALERIFWATDKGIDIPDTAEMIVAIILEQEIVSYCNEKGCVSFDTSDIVNHFA